MVLLVFLCFLTFVLFCWSFFGLSLPVVSQLCLFLELPSCWFFFVSYAVVGYVGFCLEIFCQLQKYMFNFNCHGNHDWNSPLLTYICWGIQGFQRDSQGHFYGNSAHAICEAFMNKIIITENLQYTIFFLIATSPFSLYEWCINFISQSPKNYLRYWYRSQILDSCIIHHAMWSLTSNGTVYNLSMQT